MKLPVVSNGATSIFLFNVTAAPEIYTLSLHDALPIFPLKFLLGILNDLKRAYLVRSQRGAEGGYALARPADEITLADVIRVIDGPLANVHDLSLSELSYAGPAKRLREVWMAVRASLRV